MTEPDYLPYIYIRSERESYPSGYSAELLTPSKLADRYTKLNPTQQAALQHALEVIEQGPTVREN